MITKKPTTIFLTQFFIKFSGSQTFFEKLLPPFLEKYQHFDKPLLAQSLPIVEFYHWLKYLHNFQNHPVDIFECFYETVKA
jgi:hypothetical protein